MSTHTIHRIRRVAGIPNLVEFEVIGEEQANAVIRAVDSHEALLGLCKDMAEILRVGLPDDRLTREVVLQARAAIAAASKEE